MSNLTDERESWRALWEAGKTPWLLDEYKKNKDSPLWRTTRVLEQLCDYAWFLEDLLQKERLDEL